MHPTRRFLLAVFAPWSCECCHLPDETFWDMLASFAPRTEECCLLPDETFGVLCIIGLLGQRTRLLTRDVQEMLLVGTFPTRLFWYRFAHTACVESLLKEKGAFISKFCACEGDREHLTVTAAAPLCSTLLLRYYATTRRYPTNIAEVRWAIQVSITK